MIFSTTILVVIASAFAAIWFLAKKKPWISALLAVLVGISGFVSYTHHKDVMGIPVSMEWKDLGPKFTVVFFRTDMEAERIILWLDGDQLVSLPFIEEAMEKLEEQRESMGSGVPSTFSEKGEGQGDGDGDGDGEGDGQGEGGNGGGDGNNGSSGGGWRYEHQSNGSQVPPGGLPPK